MPADSIPPPQLSSECSEAFGEEPTEVRTTLELVLEGVQKIEKRLDRLFADLKLVRLAQIEHGKKLGELETQCRRRLETCAGRVSVYPSDGGGDGNGETHEACRGR